ncbi:MAG: hypothetical protein HOP19_13215 [Acidobacteria bacterium]|nr:hypothetical protein [Acidobacteriota bacterium]
MSILNQAKEHWQQGRALQAGQLIFENLPNTDRPQWAASILRFALERSGVQNAAFEQLLYTTDHQAMWGNGHRVFSELRKITLEMDNLRRNQSLRSEQESLCLLLPLAELVAKVTYNATCPPDEFDEDSGWQIVAYLKKNLERLNQEDAQGSLWSLVSKKLTTL